MIFPRKMLAAAGTLSLVAAIVLPAAPAGAINPNINQWKASYCSASVYQWCLYYGQNGQNSNSAAMTHSGNVPSLSGYTFGNTEESHSDPGWGQQVRNNAASLEDGTPNCNVTTWVYPNYVGNYNWVSPGEGGNLTPNGSDPQQLRNNEASVKVTACS